MHCRYPVINFLLMFQAKLADVNLFNSHLTNI
jgi:hypothetical protein